MSPLTTSNNLLNGYQSRILELEKRFSDYWSRIDRPTIRNWLRNFNRDHIDIAMKLLENIDYYDHTRVLSGLQSLHSQLIALENEAQNEYYYASFSPPGKSGDEILSKYRLANEMRGDSFNQRFMHLSTLPNLFEKVPDSKEIKIKKIKGLVLVDDFIGTGNQATQNWAEIEGFLTEVDKIYLLVLAGYEEGINRIENETKLTVIENRKLYNSNRIFDPACTIFTDEEKQILLRYCEELGHGPEGFGKCQSITVFYHRVPNNTISIIRANTSDWSGLFVRY